MSRMIQRLRARAHEEDGISLIEVMFAILILTIAMSAFAGSLISSLKATTRNEQDVMATAAAQQAVEELKSVDWQITGFYEDDVVAATAPANWTAMGYGGSYTAWQARVDFDTDPPTLKDTGEELFLIAGPGAGTRDTSVPFPHDEITSGNLQLSVDSYITLLDRDADGVDDTRLLTSYVSWTDRLGNLHEIRFDTERVPTREEAQATLDIMRVMYFYVTPETVDLSSSLDANGNPTAKPTRNIDVIVETSRPLMDGTATLTWEHVDEVATTTTDPVTLETTTTYSYENTTSTVDLTGSKLATVNGYAGYRVWTTTISKDLAIKYFDGSSKFTFFGEDADPDPNLPDIELTQTVEFRNGGIPDPRTNDPVTATTPAASITIDQVVASGAQLCVDDARAVTKDFTLTIRVRGFTVLEDPIVDNGSVDGEIYVTYTRRATKYSTQTTAERVEANALSKGNDTNGPFTKWTMTIPTDAGFWLVGDELTFVIQASRPSDEGATIHRTTTATVAAC